MPESYRRAQLSPSRDVRYGAGMDLLTHTQARLAALLGDGFAHQRYLLAVSGGADSMVLLEAFRRLLPADSLVVAHFNHRTRPGCEADEALVEARAQALGLEYARAERADATGTSEEALRAARRFFLERARMTYGAQAIVTAHHADDQLETFLMRALRGSGLDGLGAMRAWQTPWLRPWLEVGRAEIRAAAQAWAVEFREDESNASERYFRNRLRARLSELASEFGGEMRLHERLAGTLEELQETADVLRAETRARAERLFLESPFWWRAERAALLRESAFWRRRVWRELFTLAGAPVPDRATLTRLESALTAGTRALEMPGLKLRQSCGAVFLQNLAQLAAARTPFSFRREGRAWVCGELGWRIESEAWPDDCELRFFRAGDHCDGTKLKEIYLARRIPQPERPLLPVLASPGSSEIRWYYGQSRPDVHCQGPSFRLSSPAK